MSSQLVCFLPINVKYHVSFPSNKLKDQAYISTRTSFSPTHYQNIFVISFILKRIKEITKFNKLITNPCGFASPYSLSIFWFLMYVFVRMHVSVQTCVNKGRQKVEQQSLIFKNMGVKTHLTESYSPRNGQSDL